MKKLINPIRYILSTSGALAAFILIICIPGSLEIDRITVEQFYIIESSLLLYIAFVWAVYKLLDDKKKGRRCWRTHRPNSK